MLICYIVFENIVVKMYRLNFEMRLESGCKKEV